ncbi:MAG: zinc ribbon domain-containing protein [Planctomycetota bacterium]
MPTYEYVCNACGHEFEEFQAITAKPLRKCPACGKLKLQRLIGTGAGVIFKGSGFYETDYRSDSYDKAKKAESDAGKPKDDKSSKSGKSSDTGKSESKPAAKAD